MREAAEQLNEIKIGFTPNLASVIHNFFIFFMKPFRIKIYIFIPDYIWRCVKVPGSS